jgi:hypothetical protein
MISKFLKKIKGSKRQGDQEGEGFPLFLNLPAELRIVIWRHAIPDPRLMYVRVSVPGPGAFTSFERFILNREHLTEVSSHPPGVLYACHESRAEALRGAQRGPSSINWLSTLGILKFHPTADDLVYLGGGPRDQGRTPPADTDRIIPLSLLLGNVLPRVMVNGDVFLRYFARANNNNNPHEDQDHAPPPPENPIEKGLASLRALNSQFAHLFADTQAGLPSPKLPESMVFMLDNFTLRWGTGSSCTVPGHTRWRSIFRCCIHYDHLEIIADGDMDDWMDATMAVQYDAGRANRIRMEIVPSIRGIWAGWRSRPDIVARVPQLFFARIRPAWVFVDRPAGHPVGTDGGDQQGDQGQEA